MKAVFSTIVLILLLAFLSALILADSNLEKMSWDLQEEILRWETLGPDVAHAVTLSIHVDAAIFINQIEVIEETGAKVVGHMFDEVFVEVSSSYAIRALAELDFVTSLDFAIPCEGGPVPIIPDFSVPSMSLAQLEQARDSLTGNEALIIYTMRDNDLLIQVIDSERITPPQTVLISKQALTEGITSLYVTLGAPTEGREILQGDLAYLYDLLIRPVVSMLEAKDTLIILPDGPLWYVPFAALIVEGETSTLRTAPFHTFARYLIEDYTISYLPSLEVANSILTSTTNATGGGFLGVYWQLSWLKEEIEQTLSCFGSCLVGQSDAVSVFDEGSITETQFKSQAPDMSFIALFSPPTFDSLIPQSSYFPLGQTTEDDGMLQAQEVSVLDLANVSLVLLGMAQPLPTALESLSSQPAMTEQQVFMSEDKVLVWPQAFLDAGAQTVIQPLWPANLSAMGSILRTLCGAYKSGVPWSHALREAQLDLLADETFYAPWFWAPYQLIGRW